MRAAPGVVIVDLGAGGNLRSVCKAVEHVGARARISASPAVVAAAGHLILPGQGALGAWMARLNKNDALRAAVTARLARAPALGICLGLQALYHHSEENGGTDGLGLLRGTVRHFDAADEGDRAHGHARDAAAHVYGGDAHGHGGDAAAHVYGGDAAAHGHGGDAAVHVRERDAAWHVRDRNAAAHVYAGNADAHVHGDAAAAPYAPLKIPHMGWNRVRQTRAHVLWRGIEDGQRFYFVHSYFAQGDAAEVAGECEYGRAFTAAAARGNLFATQFHPEKSQHAGLQLLRNFVNWDGGA